MIFYPKMSLLPSGWSDYCEDLILPNFIQFCICSHWRFFNDFVVLFVFEQVVIILICLAYVSTSQVQHSGIFPRTRGFDYSMFGTAH